MRGLVWFEVEVGWVGLGWVGRINRPRGSGGEISRTPD